MSFPRNALDAAAKPVALTLAAAEVTRDLLSATFIGGVANDVFSYVTGTPAFGNTAVACAAGAGIVLTALGAKKTWDVLPESPVLGKVAGLGVGTIVLFEAGRDLLMSAVAQNGLAVNTLTDLGISPHISSLAVMTLALTSFAGTVLAGRETVKTLYSAPAPKAAIPS